MRLSGKAWKFGDDVNTDLIIPGKYLELTDPQEMAKHAMEGADPTFVDRFNAGDLIVGGRNFGCGSSREHAPLALKYAGAGAVIAESYARIFFRNCINLGLPALTSPQAASAIQDGDEVRIDLETGEIENLTRPFRCSAPPLSAFLVQIIEAGGLTGYVRSRVDAEMPVPGND